MRTPIRLKIFGTCTEDHSSVIAAVSVISSSSHCGASSTLYVTFARICELGLQHWADPGKQRASEINRNDGGRGVYFEDPDGHLLEVITRPYGGGG